MIYFPNTKGTHSVAIPNNFPANVTGDVTLSFVGTTSKKVEFKGTIETTYDTEYLYFDYTLAEGAEYLPTGEYQYELKRGDKVISTGVAFAGDASEFVNRKEFEQTIEYEQYES